MLKESFSADRQASLRFAEKLSYACAGKNRKGDRMRYLLKDRKYVIAFAFLCSLIFGFVENQKGTAIPPIRDQFGVSYGSIGIMLMVSTLGYLMATFLGGYAGDRFGLKKVLVVGFILLIFSCLSFVFVRSFTAVVILFFILNT